MKPTVLVTFYSEGIYSEGIVHSTKTTSETFESANRIISLLEVKSSDLETVGITEREWSTVFMPLPPLIYQILVSQSS